MDKILCFFGVHKWSPIKGTEETVRHSKWEIYEYADGVCDRCGTEAEIRKEIYY